VGGLRRWPRFRLPGSSRRGVYFPDRPLGHARHSARESDSGSGSLPVISARRRDDTIAPAIRPQPVQIERHHPPRPNCSALARCGVAISRSTKALGCDNRLFSTATTAGFHGDASAALGNHVANLGVPLPKDRVDAMSGTASRPSTGAPRRRSFPIKICERALDLLCSG